MPYGLKKVKNRTCYAVFNKKTKRKFSKCTSKKNATRQMKLLRALQFNKNFVHNSSRKTRRYTRKN